MLINDDCLSAMKSMHAHSFDLIYLDPPFFTQKEQKLKNSQGTEYFFDDKWESAKEYIEYIKERVMESKRLLKDTGSLFLHCDNTMSHYLKIMLDEVFGIQNFRSEIIWYYKRWSNSKKGLLNAHQIVFFYSKSDNFKFNTIYTDYSLTTNIDQILQDRARNEHGKAAYKVNDQGDICCSKEKKGVPLADVWEIPFLNPKAKERVGYPTQKPILLLEQIIKLCTDEGDVVLDPFCGSGTTMIASKLLHRKYVGIDKNAEAIALAQERLEHPVKTNSFLLEKGKDTYDGKNEYEKRILQHFDCNIVQRNKGIDGILKKMYQNAPVAIKIQKSTEPFLQALHALAHAGMKRKCKLMIFVQTSSTQECIPHTVPENIVVLPSYELCIENIFNGITTDIV